MVRALSLLQNVGKFDNVNAGATLPFARFTVIYAENARGKTTIAAILRSLAKDLPGLVTERRRLGAAQDPKILIDIDGGAAARFENATWTRTHPDLVIFDDAFVADNVCSGVEVEGRHRQGLHELIVGAQGVALNRTLKSHVDQIETHNGNLRTLSDAIPTKDRAGLTADQFCSLTDNANIDSDIEAAERRVAAAKQSARVAEASTFSQLVLPQIDLSEVEAILGLTLSDLEADALARVQAHFATLGAGPGERWVAEGMDFVGPSGGPGTSSCPFCAQDLDGSTLIEHYRAYFGEAYRALKARITDAQRKFSSVHTGDAASAFERSVRAASEAHAFWSTVTELPPLTIDTAPISQAWKSARETVLALLRAKSDAPLEAIELQREAIQLLSAHNTNCRSIELLSDEMLGYNENLALVKEQARDANLAALTGDLTRLRAVKGRFEPLARAACDAYLAEKAAKANTEQLREAAKAALDAHRSAMFPAYETAINAFLQRLNASFRLATVAGVNHRGGASVSYNLLIDGQPVPLNSDNSEPSFRNTLSAGDRNTLALAFFFASMELDPQRAQRVVVIDDPMTSLDEHRSLHTRQEIDRLARDVAATIVLSHSKPFLLGVWDQVRQIQKAAIQLTRAGDASTLSAWNVTGDLINEHDRRFSRTVAYLANADPASERTVAEGLRPMLEAYCRVAYSANFQPGGLLGQFHTQCMQRVGGPNQILNATDCAELRALLDFSNRYHHDTNAAYATETINDTELSDFARRTLNFMGRR